VGAAPLVPLGAESLSDFLVAQDFPAGTVVLSQYPVAIDPFYLGSACFGALLSYWSPILLAPFPVVELLLAVFPYVGPRLPNVVDSLHGRCSRRCEAVVVVGHRS
jgi:hypothetical protein